MNGAATTPSPLAPDHDQDGSASRTAGAYLTHSADAPVVRRTVLGDYREIVGGLRQCRDLIAQLALRDIRIRYKQAVFGFAWALLIPMSVVLAGMLIRGAVAYASGRHVDGAQMASMAVKSVPWAFFVGCLSMGTSSLIANMSLLTKIYFPREVLPLASVLAQSFDSLIGGVLLMLVLPFLGVRPSVEMLWVPALLALLWILGLAAALVLSCANLFFRDVKYLVQVFLTFGIFVTPVVLDAPMFGPVGSRFIMLNPVAPLLEGLRLSIIEHHNLLQPLTAPAGFLFWRPWYLLYGASWAIGGLLIGAIIFHRAERRFAEVA